MTPNKLQPALLGGLFIGVLSALPVVNFANCCCLWVIGGGVLAAYLMQQNHPVAIQIADGALVGLLAGLFGGVLWAVLSIPLERMTSEFARDFIERLLESNQGLPIETREWIDNITGGPVAVAFRFFTSVAIGVIFGMLGGVLGAAMFKKNVPPSPPGTIDVPPSAH